MNLAVSQFLSRVLTLFSGSDKLSILIYHRVLPKIDPLFPFTEYAEMFTWHMDTVSSLFNVLPLNDAVERLQSKTLPPRSLCITFDDGYADNYEVALPILKKFDLPATFFVSTGYLDGGRMWNDSIIEAVRNLSVPEVDLQKFGLGIQDVSSTQQKQNVTNTILNNFKYLPDEERNEKVESLIDQLGVAVPTNLMMTTEQVKGLVASGMEVGAHTINHPILSCLDNECAKYEIEEGKKELEEIIGKPVDSFAYPNGKPDKDYTADHVKMVKDAGFSCAVSTAWGVSTASHDIYQLPRFTPWDATPLQFAFRLIRNLRQQNPDHVARDLVL